MATDGGVETADSDILYHYTRTDGMVGILTSKQIWASGISFLNDGEEFVHALKLVAGLTEQQVAEVGDSTGTVSQLVALISRQVAGQAMWQGDASGSSLDGQDLLRTADKCVSSFTKKGDMLGQWRGYGSPGDVYALGFDRVAIEKLAAEAPRRLVPPGRSDPLPGEDGGGHFTAGLLPCIYEDTEKQAAVLDTFKSAVRANEGGTFAGSSVPDWAFEGTLWSDLTRIACQLKHSSFSEECEERLVAQGVTPQDLWFRKGSTYLVPYVSWPSQRPGTNSRLGR